MTTGDARAGSTVRDGAVLGIVLGVAAALIALEYARFLESPRMLWEGLAHDRNYHYVLAQRLAVDLIDADLLGWLRDLERFRMWPPLHGLLASVPVAMADIDFRLAVLPSLLGWWLAIVFGFLAARRAAPGYGNAAGLVTAVFIAASPAHHRFSADVMLESLGAGLTLACLYFFLTILAEPRPESRRRPARALGLCLTLLLLEKYNYYLLTACGLGFATLALTFGDTSARLHLVARVRQLTASGQIGSWARRQVRHPLSWVAFFFAGLATLVVFTGGGSVTLLGQRISITRPFSMIHVAYLAVCVRIVAWCWRGGWERIRRASPPARELVLWHAVPLLLWFALPRRLGYFLHHVSPANGPAESESILASAAFYARAFAVNYHGGSHGGSHGVIQLATWEGALGVSLAVSLAAVTIARLRSLGPAARGALAFTTATLCLTLLHPHNLSRFLHSWLGSVWVLSGIGAAALLGTLRTGHSRRVAGAAMTGIVALYAASAASSWRTPAPTRSGDSIALLEDLVLAAAPVTPNEGVALVATTPAEPLLEWMFVEHGFDRNLLEIYTPKRSHVPHGRERFLGWIARARADTLIFLDVERESPWYAPGFSSYEALRELIHEQQEFRPTAILPAPVSGATITILERVPPAPTLGPAAS